MGSRFDSPIDSLRFLLKFSRSIDALTERVGRSVCWLVLAAVLISALNAGVRKTFNVGSNSWLEVQWYLFSAIFLLGAGYTLLRNEHVRIDVVSGRLSAKARAWIDLFGLVFFLLPVCSLTGWLSWPFFLDAFSRGEMSSNAGGLVRWPAKLLIPVGFALLVVQAFSEMIKRAAFLMDLAADPTDRRLRKTAEQELIEAIAPKSEAQKTHGV